MKNWVYTRKHVDKEHIIYSDKLSLTKKKNKQSCYYLYKTLFLCCRCLSAILINKFSKCLENWMENFKK